jgi:coenzyme Q-binding protein COQ10
MTSAAFNTAVERLLPYRPEQLFDLAADIERYPQFLHWWLSSEVRERRGEYCQVENTVAVGPMRLRFRSEARLQRPQRIDVTSEQEPFRRFKLRWNFEPRSSGCRVQLCAELELRSQFMQELIGQTLQSIAAEVMCAFERRAGELFRERMREPSPRPL